MQTDILQKQLQTSLNELKTAIDKFEKHPSPSTEYTEKLHIAMQHSHKLVSAYLVYKEHNDVSPDLEMHVKIMNAPSVEGKAVIIEPIKETKVADPVPIWIKQEAKKEESVIEPIKETIIENDIEPVIEKEAPVIEIKSEKHDLPKIMISINDKFRFINELFASNAVEYNIAIEQINSVSSLQDLTNYLNGLKQIYAWKEEHEVVKNLYALAQKRFS